MKKSLLALCLGVSLPCVAMAQLVPVIDPQWRATELQMKKEDHQKCDKVKNIVKSQICSRNLRKAYRERGVVEGTEEFIRKKYGSLSVTQLRDVITQMDHKYAGHVRYVSVGDIDGGPEPGEITHDIATDDVTYLNLLIDEKGGEQNPLDTLFGKKTVHHRYE